MADDNQSSWKFDLDISDFADNALKAKGMIQDIGNADNLSGLTEGLLDAGIAAGALGVAFLAAKESLDLVEEGENIKKINDQFQLLAQNAGFAGDTIKDKLVHAAAGFATDTEILKAANEEILKLGSNAQQLPELMEVARKATQVMGGDIVQNFKNISNAIASGNQRMLKNVGLMVDVQQAEKNYAAEIGKTVSMLSEEEKQHAVMEAVLEKANTQYAGLNTNLETSTQKIQKIGVSFKELGEAAAVAWEKIAGPATRSLLDTLSDKVHGVAVWFNSMFADGQKGAEAHEESLKREIDSLNQVLIKEQAYGQDTTKTTQLLAQKEAELKKINQQLERQQELQMHKAQASGPAEDTVVAPKADQQKMLVEENKLQSQLLAIKMKRLKDEEAASEVSFDKQGNAEYESDKKIDDQIVVLHQQTQNKIEEMKLQGLDKTRLGMAQIKEIERQEVAETKRLEDSKEQARLKSLDTYEKRSKSTADGIARAFKASAQKSILAQKNFGKQGQMVFDSLNKHAVSAFQALGNGSQNAAQAMRGFMFGAIGDIATAQGEELILQGIGTYNPVAIVEGGALVALGSFLSSQGSGSSSVPSSGGSSSASSSPSPAATATDTTSTTPPAAQAEKKTVSVNIQGSYFETEQTQTRLMELLRNAGDFTDFNLKQIGQK